MSIGSKKALKQDQIDSKIRFLKKIYSMNLSKTLILTLFTIYRVVIRLFLLTMWV